MHLTGLTELPLFARSFVQIIRMRIHVPAYGAGAGPKRRANDRTDPVRDKRYANPLSRWLVRII